MTIEFDTAGNEKQKLVAKYWLDSSVSDIVYGGSKGSGKSYLGASLIFGDALTYPGIMAFIARKSLNDLRKFTIPTVYEVFANWKLTDKYHKFNANDNFFTLYNGSKVFLLEAKYLPSDPQFMRFGSMQMTEGMIEEAGEFGSDATSNLQASVGRWKNDTYKLHGKVLQTCNPSKNYLYKDYYKPHKDGTLASWKRFVQAYPSDNKRLPAGYLEHLERTLKANEKERLLYGNWEYDDDPTVLMSYDKICDLFTNTHVTTGDRFITVDVARLGNDKSKVRVWNGWRSVKTYTFEKLRVDELAKEVRAIQLNWSVSNSKTIADEDGVGGGLVDILRCNGFVNNSRAIVNVNFSSNYKNIRSQCWDYAAKMVERGQVFVIADPPEQERITEELEQIKQTNATDTAPIAISTKDEIKQVIGRSPDDGDTIMMRSWFDLQPKTNSYLRTSNRINK